MLARTTLVLVGLLAVSGTSLHAATSTDLFQARALWEQGQKAMRHGLPAQAIDCYLIGLARAPTFSRCHLSLAAAYLELHDPKLACYHLGEYVTAHPDDLRTRVQYAELLVRLDRGHAASQELQGCIELAQETSDAARQLLIHCHSRLMEIAESMGDVYAEHLNRGIGLLLLARESAAAPDMEKELSSEGLFCKAAGELTLALEERPDEARPAWYLYTVWSRLGQRGPAQRCLRDAVVAAPFSFLTPVEQRGLNLVNPASAPGSLARP